MAVEKVKELQVKISNKPGAGAAVLAALKDAKVNLVAFCGYTEAKGKDAYLLMVPEDVAAARNVLKKAGKKVGIKEIKTVDVLKVDLVNKAGALQDVLAKLASVKVDVDYAYATAAAKKAVAILKVKPLGVKALKALG